ncbi:MAG: M1 family aminopeptidase [Bacteroidota bacterium]
MYKIFSTLLAASLLVLGCNTPKTVLQAPEMEVRELDTLVITPDPEDIAQEDDYDPDEQFELPIYRAAYHRKHDLLHTTLRLRFDWEKEQVIGQATLKLTPLAQASNRLRLDAKGFDFKVVSLENGSKLNYTYAGEKQEVFIDLDRTYQPGEEYTLFIDYVATPTQSGGSAAITSDKGLFFINPRGEEGDKPQQIWTQGETENNSRWFPTIDKPNERCTQEMYITVDDRYETLSNGLLISSEKNDDGTRTDYWKMDLPHAPYLFMLAVGEFAVVEDQKWNGIPVNYYVEDKYEKYAKDIFPYTPEMLTFFSELTGVQYPWSKYSQVVVRDYVSGAMENTTGVIFGEFMYGTDRDLMDADINEKIVAHEMFHHWFGDYVTCESWSNLTLNEGFANYSEYLWLEKKHGRDAADDHLASEWAGYIGGIQNGGEPHELIWIDYADKEQMFDAHSYNKGGAVLHMLRYYLGDDIFFNALEIYLSDNAYSPVEVDELRMAFEEASGQDLNWFFHQWFHKAGHPRLVVTTDYDAEAGEAYVDVKQIQTTRYNVPAIFQLPVDIDIYTNGDKTPERHKVMVKAREQRFTFPSKVKPDVIIFDAEHQLLAETEDEMSTEELVAQFNNGKNYFDRMLPLSKTADSDDPQVKAMRVAGLSDPYGGIRLRAISAMGTPDPTSLPIVHRLAAEDPDSEVRAAALLALTEMEDPKAPMLAKQALDATSFMVVGAGLEALTTIDPAAATAQAKKLEDLDSPSIISAITALYASSQDPANLGFFERKMTAVDGYPSLEFFGAYAGLLLDADEPTQIDGLKNIQGMAENTGGSPWRRIASFKALADTFGVLSSKTSAGEGTPELAERVNALGTALRAIRDQQEDGQIKQIFQQIFPG